MHSEFPHTIEYIESFVDASMLKQQYYCWIYLTVKSSLSQIWAEGECHVSQEICEAK